MYSRERGKHTVFLCHGDINNDDVIKRGKRQLPLLGKQKTLFSRENTSYALNVSKAISAREAGCRSLGVIHLS